MFLSLLHLFIVSLSWNAKESLIIYRNHALLCRLYEILSLICFLLKTILVILRKLPLSIWIYNCWKIICSATNIIMDFYLLKDDLRNRNKYMSMNMQKMKLLPKVTQRYAFSKITLKTLSTMPHSQNSIGMTISDSFQKSWVWLKHQNSIISTWIHLF